ncbi:SH3 domain [Nakaseomyces glabratus]|nr:SH3 domain [Nakaseomyces glabratus]KAH7593233.1 SH3 domain [Nakaseomyces glabratus]KAI8387203.1 SH3 domain [Nakaseomyces glabratus]KAI8397698.1 SH3 domain [Nakaseomyces glabratus]QNG13854.1 uncharacterized protein GWK60_G03377 [Nakaseomyces glabratus]
MSGVNTPKLAQLDTSFARNASTSSAATPSSQTFSSKSRFPLYIAINAYTKRMEDELDMNPGDKIQVINDDGEFNDGWFYGRNLRTKEEGLYPVVFTQVLATERKSTVMRAKSSKRIYSPSSREDLVNSPALSNSEVMNDLPSPYLVESGASAFTNNVNRNVSVKSTISDIDKALEDLQHANVNDTTLSSANYNSGDVTQNTVYSTTQGLNVNEASTVSLPRNQNEIMELMNVENWTPDEVTAYFIGHGFDIKSASSFQQHKISGKILLELQLEHLKELDISSFGTRFEMYKQIEMIREVVAREGKVGSHDVIRVEKNRDRNDASALMPAPTLNSTAPRSHPRNASHSLEDLPSSETRTPSTKHRPTSLWIGGGSVSEEKGDLFVSPRRAPKPPSYPSPVQPQRLPTFSNDEQKAVREVSQSTQIDTNVGNSKSSSADQSNSETPLSPFKTVMNRVSLLSPIKSEKKRDEANESAISEDASATSSIYASPSRSLSMVDIKKNSDKPQTKTHRRNSSIASFSSNGKVTERKPSGNDRSKVASIFLSPFKQQFTNNATKSSPSTTPTSPSAAKQPTPVKRSPQPEKRSVSAKTQSKTKSAIASTAIAEEPQKRSVSEAVKSKNKSTKPGLRKQHTSAFTEGLRSISVRDAMKNADYSGWLSKKGSGAVSVWKTRFFTLHGTRLSYFANTTDTRERGLIDITAHRVIPAKEDDKLVSLYAASTGKGRFCFKLIPPQPGSKKGLTFTQPRTHYFAVDTKDEMRGWMAALIKATIDIDTTVPVVSSYSTPTVSLSKAQELLAEAREETKLREEQLQNQESLWNEDDHGSHPDKSLNHTASSHNAETTVITSDSDTSMNTPNLSSTTAGTNGFSSPFLLASGMASPAIARKTSRQTKEPGKLEDSTKAEDTGYFDTEHHKPAEHI